VFQASWQRKTSRAILLFGVNEVLYRLLQKLIPQIAYVPKNAGEAKALMERTNYLSQSANGWSQYQKVIVVHQQESAPRSRRRGV
jgi:hypothetical protein